MLAGVELPMQVYGTDAISCDYLKCETFLEVLQHFIISLCLQVCFLLGVTPVPEQMPPEFTWIFNQDAGDAISMVAQKRAGRGKTSVVTSLDALRSLAANGAL